MAEDKKSFVLYSDLLHTVKRLPIEKAGELFIHILEYVNDLNPETDDILIQISFEPIKQQLKRDLVRWEGIRQKRAMAGRLSAKARKQKSTKTPSEKQSKEFAETTVEYRLSSCMFEEIKKRNPEHKKPNLQNWSKEIDLMIRLDKREPKKIYEAIKWAQSDPFWQQNILSTKKLRDHYDKIVIKMNAPELTEAKKSKLKFNGA